MKLNVRDLEAWFNGASGALAKAGVLAAQGTGSLDATDLETTAASEGWGQVTRQRKSTEKRGKVHALAVTVEGCKGIRLIEARPQIPLAGQVGPLQEPAGRSRRALGTQARTNLAGYARRHKVVCDRGCWAGVDLWGLEQRSITFVVPAKENRAATVDARAQAAAGEGIAMGRRTQTVRHGQGKTAWTERLETAVVGLTGLTTYDQ